jgi:hypothetical protein
VRQLRETALSKERRLVVDVVGVPERSSGVRTS